MITTGFRAARLSRGWSIHRLSEESGVSPYIIRCCEEGNVEHVALFRLLALTDTLGISLTDGMRPVPVSRQRPRRRPPRNTLENYMAYRDLNLHTLAVILDVSVQTVSVQCGKDRPAMKYVEKLAAEEDMSVPSFLSMFGQAPLS